MMDEMPFIVTLRTITLRTSGSRVTSCAVTTLDQARDNAAQHVQTRMDAFGEDREALRSYGYLAAEEAALDLSQDGGTLRLADGYEIDVRRVTYDDLISTGIECPDSLGWGMMPSSKRRPAILVAFNDKYATQN